MLVDHHCHLDFPQLVADRDGIIARAKAAGVGVMVTISTRIRQLPVLLDIAEAHDNIYCSVGTHPHNADEERGIPADEIVRLSEHPKVVAIGEAGLDYYYKHGSPEAQAEGFRRHIEAARRTGLPLEIHTRDADDDTLAILEDEHAKGAVPGHPALLHRRPEAGQARRRAGALRVVHRRRHLQEVGSAARHRARRAARPPAGRDRRAVSWRPSPIAARPTSRPTSCTPRRRSPR